jgi:hypothetical protein
MVWRRRLVGEQDLKQVSPSLRPVGAACGLYKIWISGLVVGERVLGSRDCLKSEQRGRATVGKARWDRRS